MISIRRKLMAQVQGGSPGVLPDAYQQVAYLLSFAGSSGHYSYINTGIKPAVDVSIRGVFSFENGIYTSLFGSRTGNSTPQWFVSAPSVSTPATMGFWYNSTRSMRKLSHNDEGDWFTVSMSNTEGTIVDDDGVTLFSVSFDAVDFPDVAMFLFARSNGGSPASAGVVGCKRFTIYKAGSKIQDLIPCYRKADDKPGMYDIVTDTFFVSAGDREFTVGPDIN